MAVEATLQAAAAAAAAVSAGQSWLNPTNAVAGGTASSIASSLSSAAGAAGTIASINQTRASLEVQQDDWQYQLALGNDDFNIATQQIVNAQDQVRIAAQQLNIAQLQATQKSDIVEFLANKFTNAALYSWMSSVLQGVYSYFLRQATAVARSAENQMAFERQEVPPGFIKADYWQPPSTSGSSPGTGNTQGLTGSDAADRGHYSARRILSGHRPTQDAADQDTLSSAALPGGLSRFARYWRHELHHRDVAVRPGFPGSLPAPHQQSDDQRHRADPAVPGHQGDAVDHCCYACRHRPGVVPEDRGAARSAIDCAVVANQMRRVCSRWIRSRIFGCHFKDLVSSRSGNLACTKRQTRSTTQGSLTCRSRSTTRRSTVPTIAPRSCAQLNNQTSAVRPYSFQNDLADQWYDLHNPDQSATPMTVQFTTAASDFPPNIDDIRIQQVVLYFSRPDGATLRGPGERAQIRRRCQHHVGWRGRRERQRPDQHAERQCGDLDADDRQEPVRHMDSSRSPTPRLCATGSPTT